MSALPVFYALIVVKLMWIWAYNVYSMLFIDCKNWYLTKAQGD